MIDQLIIGKVHSFDDYGASVSERKNNKPKKKTIKETVPFSNVTHDFSAINGELYWEERELEYVFEIVAESAEALEAKKQPFISWIMNVANEKLYDPFITDYHFLATFADIAEDDSEIEKSVITVTFTAYPYMISDVKRVFAFAVNSTKSVEKVTNRSSHRIVPTIVSDVECSFRIGNTTFGLPAGTITNEKLMLGVGENKVEITSTSGSGTLRIEFYEEVF